MTQLAVHVLHATNQAAGHGANRSSLAAALGVILVAGTLASSIPVPKKRSYGMREAAEYLLAQPGLEGCAILISSRSLGEATLIGEISTRDSRRPAYYVLRATKSLSTSGWYGQQYTLTYRAVRDLDQFLRSVHVRYLVLDDTPLTQALPHHVLLHEMLTASLERWKLLRSFPEKQAANVKSPKILIYRQKDVGKPTRGPSIDMPFSLGRRIGD